MAAYRIIQESLTNAIRHAGPADRRGVAGLRRGRAAGGGRGYRPGRPVAAAARETAGPGTGLIGMRGTGRPVGGTLEAGPGPDGGFRVAARSPGRGPRRPAS